VKLLRALQDRGVQPLGGKQVVRVDVRIIAASNVPSLESAGGPVPPGCLLPPKRILDHFAVLRERDDILDLANGFLVEASMEFGAAARDFRRGS